MKFDFPDGFPERGDYALEFPDARPDVLGGGIELRTKVVHSMDEAKFECRRMLRGSIPWVRVWVVGYNRKPGEAPKTKLEHTFSQPGIDAHLEITKIVLERS